MHIVSSIKGRVTTGIRPVPLRTGVALLAGCAICLTHTSAQDPPAPDPRDAAIQQLLKRVETLESEIKEMKAKPAGAKYSPPAPISPVAPPPDGTEATARDRFPRLEFHGFGEVSYVAKNRKSRDSSFALGQTDLFVTSQLADNVDVLSEMVMEAGGEKEDNRLEFQLERLQFSYRPRDYFNISAGRYHTAIGFYSTAYHHGTWFQTATGRPFIYAFEDIGGILPIHSVGVSVTGQIPSGSLGLRYIAEVGNGRHYSNIGDEPVLNVIDDNDYKSVNLALQARPDWAPGWQFGVSAYHDRVTPVGLPRIDQTIVAGHAVWQQPHFEWLNEALWFRHEPLDGTATYSLAAYTQMARQWGAFRPYLRYQYLYADQHDLIFSNFGQPGFAQAGLTHGPSLGLRYDFTDLAALKFQFDHFWQGGRPSLSQFTAQVGYTF
jgi:hypothetical protein